MINLLPPDIKESYRYARRNTRMLKWVVGFSIVIVGLAGLGIGGMFYLDQTARSYDSQIATLEADLKKQNQAETVRQVTDISNDLKLTLQVLSKQILFSQLLKQLATIIPANAALSGLNISQVSGALDITADTADYDTATQLQVNLADPANKIFSDADIGSITCTSGDAAAGGSATPGKQYPCTVTVKALFAPNNPYLFIGSGTGAKQ